MARYSGAPDTVTALVGRIKDLEAAVTKLATKGPPVETIAGTVLGNLSVKIGATRLYNDSTMPWVIRSVRASVGTAPAGGPVTVDVNADGTSIFIADRQPVIPDGANSSPLVTELLTATIEPDSYLTIDVDTVGTSTPGADLVVQLAVNP